MEAAPATEAVATLPERLRARALRLRDRVLGLPAVARSVRTLVVLAGGMRSEPIGLRAAALTYLSVLSLVPLLAVVFSVFQAVVGTKALEDQLQEYILDNLAVGARASFQGYVEKYVAKASGAALGGLGFAFLLASSVSLLANIEAAFNHIFRAPRPRPLPLRIGVYWCLLTLGPFLLSLSIAGTAMLERSKALGPLRHLAGFVLPLVVTCGAFTMLYLIVPAVTVKRRSAVLGAVVAGTAWEVAKVAYTFVSAQSVRRDAIYGSLSAIPTFLLWTYVSWVIVLFGARIAYAAQATHATLETSGAGAGPLEREVLAARVMGVVARAFHEGTTPPGVRAAAEALYADEALVARAVVALVKQGLVVEAAQGGYVPARPLEKIRLSEVRAAARGELPEPAPHEPQYPPEVRALVAMWKAADEAAEARLSATCAELVRGDEAREGLVTDPGPLRR